MTKPIKNILDTLFDNNNTWQLRLLANWDDIIGHMQAKVQLLKILDDTLILGVVDACWMQELFLLSNLLIKTINQNLDQPRIKYLRFKTVGIKKVKKRDNTPIRNAPVKEVSLSTKEQRALQKIEDPLLEDALKQYLIRCYQEK